MTNEQAIANLKEQRADFNEHYVDFAGVNESYELAIRSIIKVEELKKAIEDIKTEIEKIEISGYIDMNTLFLRDGQAVKECALDIIDKHIGDTE